MGRITSMLINVTEKYTLVSHQMNQNYLQYHSHPLHYLINFHIIISLLQLSSITMRGKCHRKPFLVGFGMCNTDWPFSMNVGGCTGRCHVKPAHTWSGPCCDLKWVQAVFEL